ncbi:MAG: amidase family protein [Gammaproteobacteria bacterium]|nr:amidase family protein [Gammaproteobacteria bacterium]MDH5309277.1 amidase family protein [Gammaproteobacteria bacterium]
MSDRKRLVGAVATMLLACGWSTGSLADERFPAEEAGIAEVHAAMRAGDITARSLVEHYLRRIEAYDKHGPAINAIITLNPRALERADELDRRFAEAGLTGPLHGIPVIVKDNYDTADMPTSAGSLSLKDSIPPDDAWQVRKLRAAGAIIIAKSNMYEFAFSPFETVGSRLPGHTRNPYALNRVPAGSSGGTAASIAAGFAVVGLGTDTGNSIRGPSSHNALVGIRSTLGLTSRDGIVPLYLDHDVGGPMARNVADAALVLDVIAGYDPADPVTEAARDRARDSYVSHLDPNGLRGARIGVLRQLSNRKGADPEVLQRFSRALDDLRAAGATVIDPLALAELDGLVPPVEGEQLTVWCPRFRYDLEAYLAALGERAPVRTLEAIIASGQYHPQLEADLRYFQEQAPPADNETCAQAELGRARLRDAVRALLAEHNLDALAYPTWSNPPRLIGDLNTPHGDNSQHVSPHTGFPAITVPMGYVQDGLPVGLQFVGDAFSEGRLIALAYAYEQSTRHRRSPPSAPPLD